MKLVNIFFPLFDHLYIFQTLEYSPKDFLYWFIRYPFKRNLQRKHRLDKTPKALLLALITTLLILIASLLSFYFTYSLLSIFLFLLVYSALSPLFLALSLFIVSPIDIYVKGKTLESANKKLLALTDIKVVAITGSYAKTSVKNILYTLLWKKYRVVRTPKSFNTSLSIAQTVIDFLKTNTQVFLVEMDAYHPGEIANLCRLVKPNMGIITAIAPQHLSRFGSMEKLASTQFELADNLARGATLFLNSSDEWSMKLLKRDATYQVKNDNYDIQIFGPEKDDDLSVTNIRQTKDGLRFILHHLSSSIPIFLPLFGQYQVINFLAAASIALKLDMSLQEVQQRAKKVLPTPHRLEIKKQGNLTIIDNSYNTNPTVSKTALKLLRDYPGKQKILITPGLVELGKESFSENKKFAIAASKVANAIIVVGTNAKKPLLSGLWEVNFSHKNLFLTKDLTEAMRVLSTISKSETVILLENDLPDQYF